MITHKKEKKKIKIGRRQPLSGPDAAALGKVLRGSQVPGFRTQEKGAGTKETTPLFSSPKLVRTGDCVDRKNGRET